MTLGGGYCVFGVWECGELAFLQPPVIHVEPEFTPDQLSHSDGKLKGKLYVWVVVVVVLA